MGSLILCHNKKASQPIQDYKDSQKNLYNRRAVLLSLQQSVSD